MASIVRRRKTRNFITFGNQVQHQVITANYNDQKHEWDIWLNKSNPELFLTLIAGVALGTFGYTFYSMMGLLVGFFGGVVSSAGILVFIQPNVRPRKVTLPPLAIPGISSMNALKSGSHYYYCPNYDDFGKELPLENTDYAIMNAENLAAGKEIKLLRDRNRNLRAQVEEMQIPIDQQIDKRITQVEQLGKASRPYASAQKRGQEIPEWLLRGGEENE